MAAVEQVAGSPPQALRALPRGVTYRVAARRVLVSICAIAASSILIALAAPGVGEHPLLAWVAFAPWLASLRNLSPLTAAVSGLLMGLAYIVPGRWDTFAAAVQAAGYFGVWRELYTLLFFASYALPFALFGLLDSRLQSWAQGSLQVAALLRAGVLASLVCGLWSPFPYTPVSAIVDSTALLQLASLGGEPLLLLLLLWPSALLGLIHARSSLRRTGLAIVPFALVLLAVAGYGHWRIAVMDQAEASGQGIRLSALPLQLDLPAHPAPMLLTRDRTGASLSALELSRSGLQRAPHCELVVWPETPLDAAPSAQVCARAQAMAHSLGRPLLMQCVRALGTRLQLTAELTLPGASSPAVHGKSSLVPMYEQPLWGAGRFSAGQPGTVMALDAQRKLIPTLCYELHAREHLRAGVLAGGNLIVHMASFTPFDRHPIDVWDQGMARLRAVEFGLPIVRAANRAPVGWIDANGRLRHVSARFGRQAECVSAWSPASGPTTYARLPAFAAWLPALSTLLLATGLHLRSARRRARVLCAVAISTVITRSPL